MRYYVGMNEVLHANIFFIIASFGTVLFIIFVTLVMWQILKIVKTLRGIIERVERASDVIAGDMMEFRSSIKTGVVGSIIKWFMNK